MNAKLYELKEKLCKELEGYSDKELTSPSLDVVDKLCHAIKNLDKIIDKHEEKERESMYGNSYNYPYNAYNDGYSRMGRNARRDSMGRYATGYPRDNNMIMELTDLMEGSPDERTRMEFQKFINKMQTM